MSFRFKQQDVYPRKANEYRRHLFECKLFLTTRMGNDIRLLVAPKSQSEANAFIRLAIQEKLDRMKPEKISPTKFNWGL